MKFEKINIYHVLLLGLILRLVFMLWGAPIYYGTEDYAAKGGDTHAWAMSMQNLVHHGTYSADLNYPDGKFFRPPGYPFFLMPFYIGSGFNLGIAFKLAQIAQVLLDTLSIFLIFSLITFHRGSRNVALLGSFLYCIYPFAIVWSPYLYAETPGIFFLLLALYFLFKPESKSKPILAGILLGFSVLLRVQIIFVAPALLLYFWMEHGQLKLLFNKKLIMFFLAFGLTYGSWPLRNLCYGKFIPAEEIVNDKHFSKDFVAYMFYIWSVKTDYNPQYDQIIRGQKVDWPSASYLHNGDSIKLEALAKKCFTCGRGFSYWKASEKIIDQPITENNKCTEEIAATFDELRKQQIKNNPLNFYLLVPLSNLKKALFKFTLYGKKSFVVKLASSLLFSYRTIFIFLGLIGIWINKKHPLISNNFLVFIFIFFAFWYLTLCFGYRNIEIRYFLINDVLLLIPASISIVFLLEKIGLKINFKN